MTDVPIRDAATVILLRRDDGGPRVLMGQRGKSAAFMPSKYVFPGGALDPHDAGVPLDADTDATSRTRLADRCDPALTDGLLRAAIREVWEETGLILGRPCHDSDTAPGDLHPDWVPLFAGHRPSAAGLRFVFRAITPPGRPRRFDARFFLADADCIAGDPDDFTHASDELAHLQWIPLSEARSFDLPFITEVVLAEVQAIVAGDQPDPRVPFFWHEDGRSYFLRL